MQELGVGGGGGGGGGTFPDDPFFPCFLGSLISFEKMGVCGRVGLNLGGGGTGRFFFLASVRLSMTTLELEEEDRELVSLSLVKRLFRDVFILFAIAAMASWKEEDEELLWLPMKVLDEHPEPTEQHDNRSIELPREDANLSLRDATTHYRYHIFKKSTSPKYYSRIKVEKRIYLTTTKIQWNQLISVS